MLVLLTSFVFYQTSWNIISKRLAESVVADINVLVKLIDDDLFFYASNIAENDFKMDWTEKINANIDFSYLTTNGIQKTSFLRHMARIYKSFEKFKIGFEDIHEHNLFYENDTLNGLSYQFYDWKIYLQQGDSSKNSFKIYYSKSNIIRTSFSK